MKLVLASGSPRRKEFLKELIKEEKLLVSVDDVDEVYSSHLPEDIVREIAILKGEGKSKEFSKDFVVSADTIVYFKNTVLGKPLNREDAIQTLLKLSGSKHSVFSAAAIFYHGNRETIVEESIVEFYDIDIKDIEKYVDSGDPFDKAGSYGIQGYAKRFVKSIEGNYSNIVGFPFARFYNKYKSIIEEINNEE